MCEDYLHLFCAYFMNLDKTGDPDETSDMIT